MQKNKSGHTSIAKLLLGLYISGIDIHVFVLGLYLSPEFIRVDPLKPPLEGKLILINIFYVLQTMHRLNYDTQ